MHISTISLFPTLFGYLENGVTGRAIKSTSLALTHWDLRQFTTDKHRTVDDRPFGGGPGMVLKVEPLQKAIKNARENARPDTPVIYLSPQGSVFNQKKAESYKNIGSAIFIAGRYEGIDERLLQTDIDEELSIGDYVLSGGEIAAMVVIDAIARLLPGTLGHEESAAQDSFSSDLLDYPQYTRPEVISGLRVPDVLLSGNHHAIAEWRLQQALGQTWLKRPDLLNDKQLSNKEQQLLTEFIRKRGISDE